MKNLLKVDVVVIGGGVAALFLAKKLTECGFSVAVVEKADYLVSGAGIKNEGWGHRGTYHAAAIPDRRIALQVAERAAEGYKQIMHFAPEVVEDPDTSAYALLKNGLMVDEVKSRWDEAGIPYREICHNCFNKIEPSVKTQDVASIFEVNDVSLNTRKLFEKLRDCAQEKGARFFTKTEICYFKDKTARLKGQIGSPDWLQARLFVHASGFGMKEFFKSKLSIELPFRFWKSHLLDLPRVSKHGIFYLDKGEATLMHHGDWSIVGSNADQLSVAEPSFESVEEIAETVKQALHRLIEGVDLTKAFARACIKVDMKPEEDLDLCEGGYARPQLNAAYGKPISGHIWMLPGKMTEAPYLADLVIKEICEGLNKGRSFGKGEGNPGISPVTGLQVDVARRPIDTHNQP